MTLMRKLSPIHPGEVLREEFLKPMGLSPYAVARACGVPRTRIERLARDETPITADTALRLSRYLGTTPAFWMGMQAEFDLERTEDAVAGDLKKIEPIKAA
jgi:addiction module HigA family antidote